MRYKTTLCCLLFILLFATFCYSQHEIIPIDTTATEKPKRIDAAIEFASRYVWRGQSFGGNYLAIQPLINYKVTPKISAYLWASTNFQKKYLDSDGNPYKGYQEIDFGISYQINSFLKVILSNYYWPSVEKVDNVDNRFFYYGQNSVQTVDLNVMFDFSNIWKPLTINTSTFIAGNDWIYDDQGENPKRNFTSYLEIGYTFNFFKNTHLKYLEPLKLIPVAGAVLNNKAQYYNAADYDRVSFTNLGCKITYDFRVSKLVTIPLYINYTHNASYTNMEFYNRNFLVAGITLKYN